MEPLFLRSIYDCISSYLRKAVKEKSPSEENKQNKKQIAGFQQKIQIRVNRQRKKRGFYGIRMLLRNENTQQHGADKMDA